MASQPLRGDWLQSMSSFSTGTGVTGSCCLGVRHLRVFVRLTAATIKFLRPVPVVRTSFDGGVGASSRLKSASCHAEVIAFSAASASALFFSSSAASAAGSSGIGVTIFLAVIDDAPEGVVTVAEVTCAWEVSSRCSASSLTAFFTMWSSSESELTPFLRAIFFSGTSSHAEDEASPSVAEVNSRRSSSAESFFFSGSRT